MKYVFQEKLLGETSTLLWLKTSLLGEFQKDTLPQLRLLLHHREEAVLLLSSSSISGFLITHFTTYQDLFII